MRSAALLGVSGLTLAAPRPAAGAIFRAEADAADWSATTSSHSAEPR